MSFGRRWRRTGKGFTHSEVCLVIRALRDNRVASLRALKDNSVNSV